MVQTRHVSGQSKHTPPVSTGGVYYVGMANSNPTPASAEPEEVTGYGYLTEAETAEAIAAHEAAVAANAKGQ